MKQKKIIFKDSEIVEFCLATRDTNEIHDPVYMSSLGKRVIVPGMFAFSYTASLYPDFLKFKASSIKVLFNSLLSSGDFVTLKAVPDSPDPYEIRLSAFNHRDTLTSQNEYTRISREGTSFELNPPGILRRLELNSWQLNTFARLIGTDDMDTANFLFAVSYASQALLRSIDDPKTEIEREIDSLINGNSKVSPFYRTLDIRIPSPFPVFQPGDLMDYYIHFETEKSMKLYTAHVRCESKGVVVFHSQYKLAGIPDVIILRMAKEAHPHKSAIPNT
jgi:hypothetical protein